MDEMASELNNSEYKYNTAREIIISGVRGLRTKLARREQKGQDKYRIAHKTLQTRLRKKLTEKENWYKRTGEPEEVEAAAHPGDPELPHPQGHLGAGEGEPEGEAGEQQDGEEVEVLQQDLQLLYAWQVQGVPALEQTTSNSFSHFNA